MHKNSFFVMVAAFLGLHLFSTNTYSKEPNCSASSSCKKLSEDVSDLSKKVQEIYNYVGLFTRQEMDFFYVLHSASAYKEGSVFETQKELFQKNPKKFRDICQSEIDHGQNREVVAEAYYHLAKLEHETKGPSSFYKSIEYLSYALEAQYTEKYARFLEELLMEQENFSSIAGTSQEIPWLETLLHHKNPTLKKNAAARLSMIYRIGCPSLLEKVTPPQIKKAIEMKKLALSGIALEKKTVHLLFVVDDKYAPHAAVTLVSALLSSDPETHYVVHFLLDPDQPLSPEVQDKLAQIKKILPFDISFDPIPDSVFPKELKERVEKTLWPKIVWYRIFAAWILKDLEKAIYLDGDLIIKRDVSPLISPEFLRSHDFLTGALNLTHIHTVCKKYHLEQYINSGVLGLALKNLRESPSAYASLEEILELNAQDPSLCDLETPDQNAINLAFSNRIHVVSRRWNWPAGFLYNYPESHMTFLNYITHFISPAPNSPTKPWDQKGAQEAWAQGEYDKIHPLYWDYWAYRDVTPWNS